MPTRNEFRPIDAVLGLIVLGAWNWPAPAFVSSLAIMIGVHEVIYRWRLVRWLRGKE